jgi:multidrug efflux pump subunit AcrB
MAFNVSAWSIKQPLPSTVLLTGLFLVGCYEFTKMPITRMPNMDLPVISVVITQFGASPAELESQVTKKVEDAVASLDGVRHIDSQVVDGSTDTAITFRLEVDPTRALNDVKDAITRIRADLPRTIDEPYVSRYEIAPLPILTYVAIDPGKTPEQLSWFVDDTVIRALQGIPGVGRIDRIGRVQREIRVGLDPVRLIGVGLTAVGVSQQLKGSNVDVAGGRAEIGGRGEAIRTLAGAKSIAELRATRIALPTGGDLRLDDLGSVTDGTAEQTTFARYNNTPVVGFSIMRSKGTSDVVVGDAVQSRIEAIRKDHPEVTLKLIDNSVTYTMANYEQALHTLYEGAVLAIVVVFFFLRDWRATLIAALTLPVSILPSFWLMNLMGFSLNVVSLLAIVLTTGILVDDAIVEIENIVRHMRMGKSPYQAALEAADEIGLAVIAISLTIVAVFVPASFMQSIPGQFFKQFGLTVAVQVLFSLICARLKTPMLAAYFLRPTQHEDVPGPFMRLYERLVTWAVRHRVITIMIGVVVFAVSMAAASVLPTGFLPPADTARSTLIVELPPGSQLVDTQGVTDSITKRLLSRPEVESVFVDGGRTPHERAEVRVAALIINYVPTSKRSLTQKQLEQAISNDLAGMPDFRFWYLDENGERNVTYIVTGQNMADVSNVANELAFQMRRLPALENVISAATQNRPELRIRPRRDLAVRLGITTESLSETIRVATIGDEALMLARYNDEAADRIVLIRVLLEEQARADQQVLEQLRVPSPAGGIPLMALADIGFGEGPLNILHHDRRRQAAVEADLVSGAALSQAQEQINALSMVQKDKLPPGITVAQGGDAELQDELFEGFYAAMAQGLTMVYVVLALLFGSLLQPLTVMFSLPLSVAGAILALFLGGGIAITTPVVIGILMLMGIVSKNAIMLVDFAVESIHRGMDRTAAIIDAGLKRARPIVMTSLAMGAGMAPSALGLGAGGEFRSPMAIAVIGGILVSTLLSLVFVPAFFTVIDDFGNLCARLSAPIFGSGEEAHPVAATSVPAQHAGPLAAETRGTEKGPGKQERDTTPVLADPA